MNKKLFFFLDFCAFFIILFIAVSVRRWEISLFTYFNNCKVFAFVFILVTFVLWLFSFYDIKALRKQNANYKSLGVAFVISTTLSAAFLYFLSARLPLVTPKAILLAVLAIYFLYVYWVRRAYFKLDFAKTTLLLFGNSETLDEIRREARLSKGFSVREGGIPQESASYATHNLDIVVVASKLFTEHPQAWDIVSKKFISKGVCVDTDFNVFEQFFRRVSRESINDAMWLLRGIGRRPGDAMYDMLKRCLDIALALCLLPFLLPAGAVIWLLIKWVDKEKPVYHQKRAGYMGKTITVYKFRTIRQKGQESNHEQITRTGHIWRRFRLDEIPQIYNVLRGDLSFVGPRPIWNDEYTFLNKYIPNHSIRTVVKPGITGWAQLNFKAPLTYVNFKNNTPENFEPRAFDGAFMRFSYDVWYIKNRSFLMDLDILLKTGLRAFIKDSHVAQ